MAQLSFSFDENVKSSKIEKIVKNVEMVYEKSEANWKEWQISKWDIIKHIISLVRIMHNSEVRLYLENFAK